MTHIFFQFVRETFVPKKTTTNMNLPIICKACWAWMMWQEIIYGWLHLNWIYSPLYIFSALLRPLMFSWSWSNSIEIVLWAKRSFIRFLPQATEFYGVDLGLGPLGPSSSGMALPILHLYCIGQGTKVTVVVTALPVYDPLKWLRMEIGRYLGWHSGDTRI